MAQRVKHPDEWDLGRFLDSVEMEVRRAHFCVTGRALAGAYLADNGMETNLTQLKHIAGEKNLSVVMVKDDVVFRRLMRPLSDTTEVMRASGDVVCEICQFLYKEHPKDVGSEDFLTVLCNGRRVKL